jgi:hypothetical protein
MCFGMDHIITSRKVMFRDTVVPVSVRPKMERMAEEATVCPDCFIAMDQ